MTKGNGKAKASKPDEAPRSNSELTEDEKRALLFHHRKKYEAAEAALVAAKTAKKAVENLAKAECGKGAVADIKELIALDLPKGSAALHADIERKLKLARWAGAAVGTQFSFEEVDRRAAEDVAYENGKIAGLKGEPRKPPHDPSVPQHQRWLEGWNAGQEVLLSDFRAKIKPAADDDADGEKPDGDQVDLEDAIERAGAGVPADLAAAPHADTSKPPFAADEPRVTTQD